MTTPGGAAPATMADDAVATNVAEDAGRLLIELRGALSGSEPERLRDEGDRRSHQFILGRLAELRPEDPVLSEEGSHDGQRLGSSRVWIVDPLDGTREFAELERDDWAVHVALCIDGRPVAAAVALPAQGVTLSTGTPPVVPTDGGLLRIVVSRTRAPEFIADLGAQIGAELIPMGSAGAKAMAVVQGGADAYIHAGGQYEWDSAAPVGVCLAAGLHASRIDGSDLVYNRPDPWLPDILVCRRALAPRLLALLCAVAS